MRDDSEMYIVHTLAGGTGPHPLRSRSSGLACASTVSETRFLCVGISVRVSRVSSCVCAARGAAAVPRAREPENSKIRAARTLRKMDSCTVAARGYP
jgi:hypothetical protein